MKNETENIGNRNESVKTTTTKYHFGLGFWQDGMLGWHFVAHGMPAFRHGHCLVLQAPDLQPQTDPPSELLLYDVWLLHAVVIDTVFPSPCWILGLGLRLFHGKSWLTGTFLSITPALVWRVQYPLSMWIIRAGMFMGHVLDLSTVGIRYPTISPTLIPSDWWSSWESYRCNCTSFRLRSSTKFSIRAFIAGTEDPISTEKSFFGQAMKHPGIISSCWDHTEGYRPRPALRRSALDWRTSTPDVLTSRYFFKINAFVCGVTSHKTISFLRF